MLLRFGGRQNPGQRLGEAIQGAAVGQRHGQARAALGVAGLTASFGFMQIFLSPLIGRWSDTIGWQPVCALVAISPLVGIGILQLALRRS